jgi:thioredoxin-dependent peroxiredoxin
MAQLAPKDKAPGFKLPDQDGNILSLGKFKGKKLLLYFYPKADTSGCTKQARSIRDAAEDLKNAGCAVAGISPDAPDKLKKFDDKHSLGFRLLSDADHAVADAYGVWGQKKMFGKTYEGIIRSSFLIDEKGKIIRAWYKVSPGDTVPSVLEALSAEK